MIPCCRAYLAIRFHILYVDFWLPYHIETWVWFLRLCSWVFLKLFNWNLGVSYSVNLGGFWCYECVYLEEGSRGMWSKSVWELGWELDWVSKFRWWQITVWYPLLSKMMKCVYRGFNTYKTSPVTFKGYSFDPAAKFSKVYKINLLI